MTARDELATAELARWLRTIYIANKPLFGDTGANPAGWELIAAEVVAQGWQPVEVNDEDIA